jgi:hypothetical protein
LRYTRQHENAGISAPAHTRHLKFKPRDSVRIERILPGKIDGTVPKPRHSKNGEEIDGDWAKAAAAKTLEVFWYPCRQRLA